MRADGAGTTGDSVEVVFTIPATEELRKQYKRLSRGYKKKIRQFMADFIKAPWSNGASFHLPLSGCIAERELSPGFLICFHYEGRDPIVVVAVSFPAIM